MERLLQVFLSPNLRGVYEVAYDTESERLSCNCPGFRSRLTCKHLRWVLARSEPDGGYCVPMPPGITPDMVIEAGKDPEVWRAFCIRHFRAEVL